MGQARVSGATRLVSEPVLAAVVLGLVAAVLWSNLAPDIQGELTATGVRIGTAQARRQFGVDGWFAVVAAGGGLVLGTIVFARHRSRPVGALVVLAVAGLVAAAVQWSVGVLLGPAPVDEPTAELPAGSSISLPLELNAPAVVLIWSIAAVVGALLVAAFLDDRERWSPRLSRRERSGPSWQR
jgi:hypothetical protein